MKIIFFLISYGHGNILRVSIIL